MNIKNENEIILKGKNHELEEFHFNNNGLWKTAFSFIQMADTQFGLTEDFKTGKDDNWEIEIAYTTKCIEIINNMIPKPEFLIVCGDMINSFPGKSNRKEQLSDFMKVFRELSRDIPLICVCGNHDVGNTPTPETLLEYRQDFGEEYMKFWVNGVKFIVINSQFYFDKSLCEEEAEKHHLWLMNELNNEENKTARHLIMFQHIPWFIHDINEPDEYFNLKSNIRREMIEKFISAGVSKIFAGHTHKNAGGLYINDKGDSLEMIVTSAVGYQLGEDDHGFRVVTIEEHSIKHEYHSVFLD